MLLVIGYGNSLRGDDGAGPLLAERMVELLPPAEARILTVQQLTPELALEMAAQEIDRVLFIDARRKQREPIRLLPLDPASASGSCGHQLQPELLLYSTRQLYDRSVPGWLLTLPGNQFGFGNSFSPATAAALKQAPASIRQFLARTHHSE